MDINSKTPGIIYENLSNIFQKGIERANVASDPLIEMVSSTTSANVFGWLQHVPGFREWYKNQPRVIRNVETNQYTVPNRKFEDTIGIPIDDVEDNQIGSYSGVVKQMGAAGKLLQDKIVFQMFNNAFTTQLTYDGLSWLNVAHKVGLSTINNVISGALTDATFEEACTRLQSFTFKADKISDPEPLNPNANKLILVVNPRLLPTAKKIIKRKMIGEAGASVDNINYESAEILSTSYVTSVTGWFIVNVDAPLAPVMVQERKKLEFRNLTPKDSDMSFINDQFLYGAKCRMACCPTYPWLIVGSTGL